MKRLWIAVQALVLLIGCAAAQLPSVPAAVPQNWTVASAHGTAAGQPIQEVWWQSFHDAELDALIARAAKSNLDLKIAAERVQEARAARGITKSSFYPSVEEAASASRFRERAFVGKGSVTAPGVAVVPVEANSFQGGVDASWELDVFGRIRHAVRAATADVAAAEENRHDVLVILLADVGRYYTQLRGFQLRLAIARKNIQTQQETLDLISVRTKAGLASQLDVSRAAAQLETTRSVVPTIEEGVEVSIHRLSVLLGEQPGALDVELQKDEPLPVVPPDVPVGLPSDLLTRRPDIRRAEAQLNAAAARVGEAKAEWFPRFVLFGSAGRQASQLHDLTVGAGNFFSVGPGISLPIFTGGRIRSNVAMQNARFRQANLSYQSMVLAALEETENGLLNYSKEQERRDRLEGAVDQSKLAVELANEQYKAGLVDFLSVLDAQRELFSNEDLLAQSRTTLTANLVVLYKALGGGWDSAASVTTSAGAALP